MNDILITDIGLYVNHRLPCLKELDDSIILVKIDESTGDIPSNMEVIDVSGDTEYMDMTKTGFESWQYQCISNHTEEVLSAITSIGIGNTWFNDIIILGDINPETLYVMDVIQRSPYKADMHLILPLPFEMTVKGTIQHELLSNMDKVKSLAVYDPYKLAIEKYGSSEEKNVKLIIDEQTGFLLNRLSDMNHKMLHLTSSSKYFYDYEKDSYIDTDSLYVLDEYEIHGTLGLMIDPYIYGNLYGKTRENEYFIECLQKPVPRPDGKSICEKLRSIRKEFAMLNGLLYEFKECSYKGPCAGTCEACDEEARALIRLAKERKDIIYPKISLEDEKI